MEWYDGVDAILNIHQYASTFFEIDQRLAEAEALMAKAPAVELPQARRWHSRVVLWAENIRRDLRKDAVAAPRGMEAHWMLYMPKKVGATDSADAGVVCDFCKNCAAQFTRLRGRKEEQRPAVRMPLFARANGLWGWPLAGGVRGAYIC